MENDGISDDSMFVIIEQSPSFMMHGVGRMRNESENAIERVKIATVGVEWNPEEYAVRMLLFILYETIRIDEEMIHIVLFVKVDSTDKTCW